MNRYVFIPNVRRSDFGKEKESVSATMILAAGHSSCITLTTDEFALPYTIMLTMQLWLCKNSNALSLVEVRMSQLLGREDSS